jgi:hypothetical protein
MQVPSYNQGMALVKSKSHHRLIIFLAISAISLINLESRAQSQDEICPCFSMEEIESIFLIEADLPDEERNSSCSAEDYKVECSAEVIVMDQDYEVIAQARVDWVDFDPGGCEYTDTRAEPPVEREVRWPHPAPEATARACFNIISSVIAKADTAGICSTYP